MHNKLHKKSQFRFIWTLPSVLAIAGSVLVLLPLLGYLAIWLILAGIVFLYVAMKLYFS